jgi:methyl-accepting chemotaxis protein
MKIRNKLLAAFGVVILVISATAYLTNERVRDIHTAQEWNSHTYLVLDHVDGILGAMVNQETGVRGYLVTGDAKFLEPYKTGKQEYEKELAEVKRLTADNPMQQARLAEVDRFAKTWQNEAAAREISLMEVKETQDQARAYAGSGVGKASMDGLRAKIAEIENAERVLLEKRSADTEGAFRAVTMYLMIAVGISIVISLGLAMLLAKAIATPIQYITGIMRRLAEGDTSVEVVAIDRSDEVGQLTQGMKTFLTNLGRAAEVADEIAKGNINVKTDGIYKDIPGIVQHQCGFAAFYLIAVVFPCPADVESSAGTVEEVTAGGPSLRGNPQRLFR